jgi:hypothetical protein
MGMVAAGLSEHVQEMAAAPPEGSSLRCVLGTRHRRLRGALE